MTFSDALIDQLLQDYQKPEDLLGEQGILKELTKRLLERALAGELTHHLGYQKHDRKGRNSGNSRNGSTPKNVVGDFGEIAVDVPRDRNGAFQPQILKKGQNRFSGFDDKVISLYARGLSTREIQGHLEEIYGVDVSPAFISNITHTVREDVRAWQNRPLEEVYPIVYFDAMRVKVRSDGQIINKAVYLGLGINMDGTKELLGMWIRDTEGAKFWLSLFTELHNRGLRDIFIACVDGLTGFPDAIQAAFPHTKVQLCIVHLIRHALSYVSYRDRKALTADLKKVYTAPTVEQADAMLTQFAATWDRHYPNVSTSWRRHWQHLTTFLDYPQDIRRILYTTNPIESVNRALRKVSKNRGVFPSDDAVKKLFYLAALNITKKWSRPINNWKGALNRFFIQFGDRVPSF